MRRPLMLAAAVALAVPLLAACGSDGGTEAGSTPSATATPSPSATCVAKDKVTKPTSSKKFGETPKIAGIKGTPPCDLIVKDLKVGKGEPVTDTSKQYDWNYEGVAWSNGQIFDSSFARGEAIAFPLNGVIPGWTEGLQGMKPGGRRLLVIPPDKAYGNYGNGGIGPNETLVFVVDLVGPADTP